VKTFKGQKHTRAQKLTRGTKIKGRFSTYYSFNRHNFLPFTFYLLCWELALLFSFNIQVVITDVAKLMGSFEVWGKPSPQKKAWETPDLFISLAS